MKRQILSLSLALSLLVMAAPAFATVIYVSGDQTGAWSADTVIVTAEVRVPPGQSLTIQPGVKVLFSVYCKLIVASSATLLAVGTPADSIRFDVLPPNTTWHGIRFLSASDSSRMEYCHLTHGRAIGAGEESHGGAIYCSYSDPSIQHCLMDSCSAANVGGAICCASSSPYIIGNIITGNSTTTLGGGIYCFDSNPTISGNTINGNSASVGGGIYCQAGSIPIIIGNIVIGNSASQCGGIECYGGSNPLISGNTIGRNTATTWGGGIFSENSYPTLVNCILWANSPEQIYVFSGSPPQVNYSDIQGGYPGLGNINADPLFINPPQNDYHLTWPSPCIDTGDPLSPHDPDSTRADIGAYFYDYLSLAVSLSLIPTLSPVQIPAPGGSFTFTVTAVNPGSAGLPVDFWTQAILPDSSLHSPLVGPLRIILNPGSTSGTRSQRVPGSAPAGFYSYQGRVGIYPNIILSQDAFPVEKLTYGQGPWVDDWSASEGSLGYDAVASAPSSFQLQPCSPNPFNSTTQIHFALPQADRVRLKVYNTSGQLVATLADGQFQAGWHAVTWDASNLSTGLYLYRLEAGGKTMNGKAILVK